MQLIAMYSLEGQGVISIDDSSMVSHSILYIAVPTYNKTLNCFSSFREKVTALEVSIAKCLEVLSTLLSPGRSDHRQQSGLTSVGVSYVFPTWHVNHFLLKLRTTLHRGGLHKFLTKDLKVLHVASLLAIVSVLS